MNENEMMKLLICFILGWLFSRMIGNGFSVGGQETGRLCFGGIDNDNDGSKDCNDSD